MYQLATTTMYRSTIDFLCMYRQDVLFLCINHFATNQVFARTTKSYQKKKNKYFTNPYGAACNLTTTTLWRQCTRVAQPYKNGKRIRNTEQQKASHTMTNEEELEIQNNKRQAFSKKGFSTQQTNHQERVEELASCLYHYIT